MKQFKLLIIFSLFFCCLNAQVKRTNVSRTPTSEVAEQKTEAEEKVRLENNNRCAFAFDTGEFVSEQNSSNDYVIYEIPSMKSLELKDAVFTILSSICKSPKDVITSISDNMIQLEGIAERVYSFKGGNRIFFCNLIFDMVIQFKDGKVRYNKPTIKQMYDDAPLGSKAPYDMKKPLSTLIYKEEERRSVCNYFNNLINNINKRIEKSNDW